jgi:glutathione S-transferase
MSMTQEAADQYNSVQRAHQNTVENQPLFLTMLLVGSLGFPAIAAAIGFLWLVSRVMYGVGYYKQPQARVPGGIVALPMQ